MPVKTVGLFLLLLLILEICIFSLFYSWYDYLETCKFHWFFEQLNQCLSLLIVLYHFSFFNCTDLLFPSLCLLWVMSKHLTLQKKTLFLPYISEMTWFPIRATPWKQLFNLIKKKFFFSFRMCSLACWWPAPPLYHTRKEMPF